MIYFKIYIEIEVHYVKSIAEQPQDDCGVREKDFPCLKHCCEKKNTLSGSSYEGLCLNCRVWRSMPDGDSLVVTHIVECAEHDFMRRIRE